MVLTFLLASCSYKVYSCIQVSSLVSSLHPFLLRIISFMICSLINNRVLFWITQMSYLANSHVLLLVILKDA